MSPDGITLYLIVNELQDKLLRGRVDRIFQPERQEIIIVMRNSGRNFRLLISAQAENARLHLTTQEKTNPPAPPLFCLILRKYLEGSRLLRIEQTGLDRIVNFTFSRLDESGDFKEIVLTSEIMGKHSNLILLDPETGLVIDGIKRYSHVLSRYREVLPGSLYLAPPAQKKVHPLQFDHEEHFIQTMLAGNLETPLDELLFRRIAGIGPELAREIVFRARLAPGLRLEYCGEYELHAVWQSLQDITIPLLQGKTEPTLVFEQNHPVCFAPIPLTQYTDLQFATCETVNRLLDRFYSAQSAINKFRQLRNRIATVINHEINRCAKKLILQQEARAEAEQAHEYRIKGEMLLAHLHLVKPGQKEIMIPNLYDQEASPLQIELDPSLTPSQNAQKLFRRYDKARDSLKIVIKRETLTKKELNYLSSVKLALDQTENLAELNEIKTELEDTGYLKTGVRIHHRKKQQGQNRKQPPQVFRVTSHDGLDILVGKNNKQNDYLTMRLARDEDIWLHSKDMAGAHVVIKALPGRKVPPATLEQAAQLAAYFSEARFSSKVPVDYTTRKNVSKPPKARPGYVIYKNYETILVTPKAPENPQEDINARV